jgi:hypothetical protein
MVVSVRYLNRKGDEHLNLSVEETEKLIEAESGKYYVVDEETQKILQEVKVEDGQKLVLMPIVAGG